MQATSISISWKAKKADRSEQDSFPPTLSAICQGNRKGNRGQRRTVTIAANTNSFAPLTSWAKTWEKGKIIQWQSADGAMISHRFKWRHPSRLDEGHAANGEQLCRRVSTFDWITGQIQKQCPNREKEMRGKNTVGCPPHDAAKDGNQTMLPKWAPACLTFPRQMSRRSSCRAAIRIRQTIPHTNGCATVIAYRKPSQYATIATSVSVQS